MTLLKMLDDLEAKAASAGDDRVAALASDAYDELERAPALSKLIQVTLSAAEVER